MPGVRRRDDVVCYTTEPLSEDLVICGRVFAELWVSSTAADTEFCAMLCDVHETAWRQLCDGNVRLALRNSLEKRERSRGRSRSGPHRPVGHGHPHPERTPAAHRKSPQRRFRSSPRIRTRSSRRAARLKRSPRRIASTTIAHASRLLLPVVA